MARRSRSRSRDLAGLAALGALGYLTFGSEGRGRAATSGGSSVAPAATQVRQQPSDLQGMFEGLGPLADTGGMGRSEVTAADQTTMPPPVAARPAAAPAVRSIAAAAAPAAAAPAAAAPAAAAPRRSSYDQENVFDPGQDIGPNISGDISRRTGVKLDNPAGAGRSSGQGGASAEEIRQFMEGQGNVSAAVARRTGVNLNSRAGAGRGTQGGPTARELEAYRRQQEELAKRGRGFNTPRRKEGGAIKVKKMASGGMSSASKRGDGIATKGKTKCKMY